MRDGNEPTLDLIVTSAGVCAVVCGGLEVSRPMTCAELVHHAGLFMRAAARRARDGGVGSWRDAGR